MAQALAAIRRLVDTYNEARFVSNARLEVPWGRRRGGIESRLNEVGARERPKLVDV